MVRCLPRVNKPLHDMSKGTIQKCNVSHSLVPSSLSVGATLLALGESKDLLFSRFPPDKRKPGLGNEMFNLFTPCVSLGDLSDERRSGELLAWDMMS